MSESTASRLDRVGREQRREERQRSSTTGQVSSNLVSSSALNTSSSSNQSQVVSRSTKNTDGPQSSESIDIENSDSQISTSTLEAGNNMSQFRKTDNGRYFIIVMPLLDSPHIISSISIVNCLLK